MAHGGSRPGSGRKPGSTNTKTREIADRAMQEGLTPLEYMLNILRDETADPVQRFEAAKQAAPYIHPRLSTVQANVDANVETTVTKIELVGPA